MGTKSEEGPHHPSDVVFVNVVSVMIQSRPVAGDFDFFFFCYKHIIVCSNSLQAIVTQNRNMAKQRIDCNVVESYYSTNQICGFYGIVIF